MGWGGGVELNYQVFHRMPITGDVAMGDEGNGRVGDSLF